MLVALARAKVLGDEAPEKIEHVHEMTLFFS